jgi:RNA polymerase sigma factor (sigma-70 family)
VSSPAVTTSPNDSDLRDARWFAEHVHVHEESLRAHVRGAFPAMRDVDDVVQESYLRLWRARAREPIQSARAFLFTIARRIALDVVRKQRNSPIEPAADPAATTHAETTPGVAEHLDREERVQLVTEALLTLPPRCREAVMLYKLKGLSRREVATALGISEKTVDEQVARGVKRLEQHVAARLRGKGGR